MPVESTCQGEHFAQGEMLLQQAEENAKHNVNVLESVIVLSGSLN
jgi:quercetin dioxygenase-like cupin family protein